MDENKETGMTAPVDKNTAALAELMDTMLRPIFASVAELLKNNTEAIQYLAAQQKVQTDRMEALEKQIRLNTLVTPPQEKYIKEAIKKRAIEILAKKGLDSDSKAVTKLGGIIRKAVLSRYGIAALHDIPKHEYSVAMQQIATWNDVLAVMDVVREARNRKPGAEAYQTGGLVKYPIGFSDHD